MLKREKGITLIALIITIIVMLILVGVTINIALNGGLFSKAEEATTKTKIAQVQEALAIKESELIADNEGVVEEYTLTLADLELPEKIKNEFSGKLIIGKDGELYYDSTVVTNTVEQNTFETMGIQAYVEQAIPDPTRIPFTNYIEDGNYYYVAEDQVGVISRNASTITFYTIVDGKIVESDTRTASIIDIIDKEEIETELGYTKEMVEQGLQTTFEEISDDVIIVDVGSGMKMPIIFKSNYTITSMADDLFTLDTGYKFPNE